MTQTIRWRTTVETGLAIITALVLASIPTPAAGEGAAPALGDVTFTKDVAPILHRSCVNCHRPGSIAPMSLITYEDVRPWARAIRDKTSRPDGDPERMPPWFIEKNVGLQKFKDDPSLSTQEVATISAWVDNGAPRGDAGDMPELTLAANEWTIGTPDLIISSPRMTLPAVAPDFYGRIGPSPTGLTEDRYVKAVEFREIRHDSASADRKAGDLNFFVLHHAVVTATPGADAAAGSSGGGVAEGRVRGLFNVVWELGQNSTIYPDVLGVKLAKGSALNYDLHTHSIGAEATFSIDVAFVLHPKGYEPKYTNAGSFNSLTYDLDIPGNKETVIEALYPMGQAALVLGFEPHLHSSGRRMCVEAPASERVSGDAELCRIQPQLGEGVSLPGRCDTVAPQGHGDQGHRVVRQHGVESARRGPAQLEGLG